MAPVSQEPRLVSIMSHFMQVLPKVALPVLASICCTFMSAVETTGVIQGTVEDATHAVIPDVRVTLVNMQTGESRTVTTGSLGRFVFSSVAVGTYVLTAEREKFTKLVLSDIRVKVDTTVIIVVPLNGRGG